MIWNFLVKGGPMMIPIIFCSVMALAIVIERAYYLYKIRVNVDTFMVSIGDLVRRNRIVEAINFCESIKGPVSAIVRAGLLRHDRSRSEVKEAIEDAGMFEVPNMEKGLGMLATIAHISPLLGLLGTVTGMVKCFQTIQQKSNALMPVNPADLAGGIWEALITTAVGLIVAIPTIVAYNYLVGVVSSFVNAMEGSATELLTLLSTRSEQNEV